jgi:hypothetical protein
LRLDQMIDLRHPLAVLASDMPQHQIATSVAHRFARKARAGVVMPDLCYRGVDTHNPDVHIVHYGKVKHLISLAARWLRRL